MWMPFLFSILAKLHTFSIYIYTDLYANHLKDLQLLSLFDFNEEPSRRHAYLDLLPLLIDKKDNKNTSDTDTDPNSAQPFAAP